MRTPLPPSGPMAPSSAGVPIGAHVARTVPQGPVALLCAHRAFTGEHNIAPERELRFERQCQRVQEGSGLVARVASAHANQGESPSIIRNGTNDGCELPAPSIHATRNGISQMRAPLRPTAVRGSCAKHETEESRLPQQRCMCGTAHSALNIGAPLFVILDPPRFRHRPYHCH